MSIKGDVKKVQIAKKKKIKRTKTKSEIKIDKMKEKLKK